MYACDELCSYLWLGPPDPAMPAALSSYPTPEDSVPSQSGPTCLDEDEMMGLSPDPPNAVVQKRKDSTAPDGQQSRRAGILAEAS